MAIQTASASTSDISIRLERNTLNVLGEWGARPAAAKYLLDEYKSNPEITHDMFAENMARWYVENNGQAIEEEFAAMLQNAQQDMTQPMFYMGKYNQLVDSARRLGLLDEDIFLPTQHGEGTMR